jgi:L-iditol 2-dehydrogenase
MKAALFYGAGDIRVEERPVPEIDPREVLVKIKAAGICGSDLHGYRSAPKRSEGRLFGHEYSGQVVKIGPKIKRVSVEDRVGLEPLVGCGECEYCLTGNYHLCPNLWHIPGFMEYQKFPEGKVFKLPENVSYEEASTLDCIAVAVHAAKLSGIKGQETALVLGAGTMGLLTMQTVKAFGAGAVYQTGTYDFQTKLAEELGADAAVNARTEDLSKRMIELTGKEKVRGGEVPRGVAHIFEAVGGPKSPLEEALKMVRRGGTVTVIGTLRKPVNISSFVMREVKIIGSSSYAYYNREPEFEIALNLLSSSKVNAERLITHTFPLEEIKQAFNVAADKQSKSIKVVVKP